MTSTPLTLDQCGDEGIFRHLAAGNYSLEYSDNTHHQPNEWDQLAEIEIRDFRLPKSGEAAAYVGDEQAEQFFTIRKQFTLSDDGGSSSKKTQAQAEMQRKSRSMSDSLSLALGRCGLLAPELPDELLSEVISLNCEGGVVLVPDTNALHNGAMHWLLRVLNKPSIWILPLVASITTVQTRDASLKSLVGKAQSKNCSQALRSRSVVNGGLGLLERNKGRSQVVEIDPSLLRYQRTSSNLGTDPDQGDVLEDRLIIEGVHNVLRSMRSRTARRVVTSDVNIARVLSAEGIDTLFVPTIEIGEAAVPCVRYDALAKSFVGSPLRAVMWEIAHAFGSVRLRKGESPIATLHCYWPGKSPADWKLERLKLEREVALNQSTTTDQASEAPSTSSDPLPEITSTPDQVPASTAPVEQTKPTTAPRTVKPSRSAPSSLTGGQSPLPRAAFPQLLQLLGAARRLGGGDISAIVSASQGDPLSPDAARRALDILGRVRLVTRSKGLYRPTADADLVDQALRQNDLDAISAIFDRFEPYAVLGQAMKERGRIARTDAHELLAAKLGPVGTYESERLPRFHVLLGQAWTNKNTFLDGSHRPTDRDATDFFADAFRATAVDGIAKVVDLLPKFCELTRMSPWAAKMRIERFVAERLLPHYSFQPAAGGKPVGKDTVVAGNLDQLRLEPVIIDRLHLGESPVFTIGGAQ